jgi:hypothetical protein
MKPCPCLKNRHVVRELYVMVSHSNLRQNLYTDHAMHAFTSLR